MRILLLCTHNVRRSQMAEALLRWLARGRCQVFSAGTEPGEVNPRVLAVLHELGVPTEGMRSKSVEEFAGQPFDLVLTVYDHAREHCPVFPSSPQVRHWSLPDPGQVSGDSDRQLAVFCRVRDELLEQLRQEILPLFPEEA